MSKYVFIGSEAEGRHSGAYECVGVVVSREVYDKYEEVLSSVFEGKCFHELDGKHSEVRGTELLVFFDSLAEAVRYTNDISLDRYIFEDYLYDYVDSEDITEEDQKIIEESVRDVQEKIVEYNKNFEEVSFYLSKEDAAKVKAFVKSLNNF